VYLKVLFQYRFRCFLLVFKKESTRVCSCNSSCSQAIMSRNVLAYLDMKQEHITKLLLTIKQRISKSYNPSFKERLNTSMLSLFYLREGQQKGDMNLVSVNLKTNLWIYLPSIFHYTDLNI
jgi:hypothetical protein